MKSDMKRKPKSQPPVSANSTADAERFAMGRVREDARFTAAPPAAALPAGYGETLAHLKELVRQTRLKTVLAANATMVMAYWQMGQTILERQAEAGWGAKVIDRLSAVTAGTSRAEKLTQAILAKAFRGELVPTEAERAQQEGRDCETAAGLLVRIQAVRLARTLALQSSHQPLSWRANVS